MPATPPPVTGLNARYFGPPGGATSRNYWVRALYPDGSYSLFAGPITLTTAASLGGGSVPQSGIPNVGTGPFVAIGWNPAPGAVAYDVICTPTNTYPSGRGNIGLVTGLSTNSFADVTQAAPGSAPYLLYTPLNQTYLNVAFMRYDFAVDGGAISTLIPASYSDVIPADAVILGGTFKVTTAFAGASSTFSAGTSAGSSSSSLLSAVALASLGANALVNLAATFAAPVRMTAAGQLNVTIAVGALTAGAGELFALYVVPSN